MRRTDRALIIGGSLLAIAISTFFIFFTLNDSLVEFINEVLFGGIGNKMVVVAVALLIIIIAIKIILDTSQRINPYMAVVASGNDLGTVSINISALERTILQLTTEFKNIEDAKVFVEPKKKGVNVVVEIETPIGDDLQVVTQKLQKVIKDRFEKGIGIHVLDIQILVKSLGVLNGSNPVDQV